MKFKLFLKEAMGEKKSIAIDFDRVIHSYDDGWRDGKIYGTVVNGAREAINKLKKNYKIIIFTSRILGDDQDKKKKDMENWLSKNGIYFDEILPKVLAVAYVDDRAITVDPHRDKSLSWGNAINKIKDLEKNEE